MYRHSAYRMFATHTKYGCRALVLGDSSWRRKCSFAHGITPLYTASHAGHIDTVKILLAAGADVDAANMFDGATALCVAAREGNLDIVSALLDYGADLNIASYREEKTSGVYNSPNDKQHNYI
jgi:ankyrin repeat protein